MRHRVLTNRVLIAVVPAMLVWGTMSFGGPSPDEDWAGLVSTAQVSLEEAIDLGMRKAGSGRMFCAELERDRVGLVYSLDIVQGETMRNILIDAATGDVVQDLLEHEDHTRAVSTNKVGMKPSIRKALERYPGKAFYAIHFNAKDRPGTLVSLVHDGEAMSVVVNGVSGEVSLREEFFEEIQKDDFTRAFAEDKAFLGPTGRNAYFVLEPGYQLVFEGTEEGEQMRTSWTVLDKTRVIDGVTTRAIEEREYRADGKPYFNLNYYAISAKSGNVYYFGETLESTGEMEWESGRNDCHYGLMMPAIPLVGAKYYAEIAPHIAMDRNVVESVTETVATPAGVFRNVIRTLETNPLEPDAADRDWWAPGVGLVQQGPDGEMKLVSYGFVEH